MQSLELAGALISLPLRRASTESFAKAIWIDTSGTVCMGYQTCLREVAFMHVAANTPQLTYGVIQKVTTPRLPVHTLFIPALDALNHIQMLTHVWYGV